MRISALNNLKKGERAQICSLELGEDLRKRLLDIGVIPGTEAECLFASAGKSIAAYLVRGTVIALRACDAEKITVLPCEVSV